MKTTDKQCVRELVNNLKEYLSELSYSDSTISRYDSIWKRLIIYCDEHQYENFTMEIGRNFIFERFGAVLGEKDTSHNLNRAIHILSDYQNFGIVFKISTKTLKNFSFEYQELFEMFLNHLIETGASLNSIPTWKSRLFRFEKFLLNNNIKSFNEIKLSDINNYEKTLVGFSSGTIGGTQRILKKLSNFAFEHGYHNRTFSEQILTVKRTNKYEIPTTFTAEEIDSILGSIDTNNPLGKRNYAIMILLAKYGLRISDVLELKFKNIDWYNDTISIHQQKTGIPLELPLLEDVGWAIIQYLEHGRPISDYPNIFIRHIAPFDNLGHSFHRVIVATISKAGIKKPANKAIGTHSFRHSIATTMLSQGVKITDIEQILGHTSLKSTEQYIRLDVEMLRECALEVCL